MAKMRWFPVESVGIDRIWPILQDQFLCRCSYGFHPIPWGRCRKWVYIFLVSEAKGIHTHPTKSLTRHLSGCQMWPRRVGKHIWDVGYFDFGHQWLALGFARRASLGNATSVPLRVDKNDSWGLTGVAFLCWVPSRLRPEGITVNDSTTMPSLCKLKHGWFW